MKVDVVVVGSGPGGYSAAFRAADLGQQVALVERDANLGGVCLNVGCIPSKALLHAAKVISDTREMAAHGITFGAPQIDLDGLRGWKEKVVGQLTKGLVGLAGQRKVEVVHGVAAFTGANTLEVSGADGKTVIEFTNAIIAAGSEPVRLPGLPYDDPRVIDSTGALALTDIPQRMLVVGGGIIGLEMATVYMELGTRVSVVELTPDLMLGADRDIVKPLEKRLKKGLEAIYTKTKLTQVEVTEDALIAHFEGGKAPATAAYDRVLVAVGRTPNGKQVAAEKAGVAVDERGFIQVDTQMRSNVPHIFAIGDIVGQPMLAHKAVHEGKVAAEVIAGHKVAFDARVIPSVAYTDPEVAWVGLTETQAKADGTPYGKGAFPWAASGRSLSLGRNEGITKLLFNEDDGRIIGAGIVGPNAGDLIAEVALAIEMGCDAEDIALTIHPHPTLSETVAMGAEVFSGTITDLYMPKRR
jgi:dihydrolipoamide dehydrogenase